VLPSEVFGFNTRTPHSYDFSLLFDEHSAVWVEVAERDFEFDIGKPCILLAEGNELLSRLRSGGNVSVEPLTSENQSALHIERRGERSERGCG